MSHAKRFHAGAIAATTLLAAAFAGMIGQAVAEPMSPDGIWYTKGEESIIKVHACGQSFCGTLVWLKEPTEADGTPKIDKLNKDATKKNRPLVGADILFGMKPDEDHYKGKAYNADDGKIYDITFKVKEDNESADLRGCILGFLCQTETFVRAKSIPGGGDAADAAGKKHKGAKNSAKR